MLRVVADDKTSAELTSSLHEIVREGARRRLVVRNGHAEPRHIVTGAGAVEVVASRVSDRRVDEATGERRRFRSSIVSPWADVLRDVRRRGMNAPTVAVGDGA